MHPVDQTSIAGPYSLQLSSSSGALYHLVTTYSVMSSSSGGARARPKSHTFKSQLAFRRRFDGFKSLCSTPAEWMYFNALSTCDPNG